MTNPEDIRFKQSFEAAEEKFEASDAPLFFVDDSAGFRVRILAALIKGGDARSALLVVRNERIAQETSEVLSSLSGKKFVTFDKAADTVKGADANDYAEVGRKVKEKFPWLVVPAAEEESKKAVLFGSVCAGNDYAHKYHYDNKEKYSDVTVADVLAEGRYDLFAADDVYSYFSFVPAKQAGKTTPVANARFDFDGQEYFTEGVQYRILRHLSDSAKKKILMSDSVIGGDVVNLAAALDLVCDSFSFFEARDFLKGAYDKPEEVYEEIFNDIINSQNDIEIVNACFHEAHAYHQAVPSGVEIMDDYIDRCVEYTSQEEIALRTLVGFIDRYYKGTRDINTVLDEMQNNDVQMARGICAALFGNDVKGELEKIGKIYVREFDNDAASEVKRIFDENCGVLASKATPRVPDAIRLRSDDCVFDFLAARYANDNGENIPEAACSAHGVIGNDPLRKALVLSRVSGEGQAVRTPSLVLTADDRTNDAIKAMLDGKTLTDKPGEKADFTLINYKDFLDSPRSFDAAGAVLFDIPDDFGVFRRAVGRLNDYGMPVTTVLLSDTDRKLFDDYAARFDRIFGALPVTVADTALLGGGSTPFGTIFARVRECEEGLKEITVGRSDEAFIKDLTEKFAVLMRDYLGDVPVKSAIEKDFKFLSRLAAYLNLIIGNSVTIGGGGERVEGYSPYGEYTEPVILFNVCSLMLTRKCDLENNDCNGCKYYDKRLMNDYSAFSAGASDFFDEARRLVSERASGADEGAGKIIQSADSGADDAYRTLGDVLPGHANEASALLGKVAEKKKGRLFAAPFGPVGSLRELAADDYRLVFDKYLKMIKTVYGSATEKVGGTLDALSIGAAAALK